MAVVVHYEVYVQDARGWSLQARYPEDQRERAVAEAKALEVALNKPVRVNREIYDSATNTAEDHVAYVGFVRPKPMPLPRPGQPGRQPGAIGAYGRVAAFDRGDGIPTVMIPGARTASSRSATDFVVRIVLVMVASLGVAVVGTALGSMTLGRLGILARFDPSQQSALAFGLFLALFLMTAVPLVMTYVPLDSVFSGGGRRGTSRPSPAPPPAPAPPPPPATKPEDIVETALTARDPEEGTAGDDGALPPEVEDDAAPDAPPASPPEDIPTPKDQPPATDIGERVQVAMMGFLNAVAGALKVTHPHLDAYNKFGVNLYLAGACEALATQGGLPAEARAALMREAVEVVGTRPEQARHLVERLEGYKKQARYAHMIAAGRLAMEVHLSGDSDPFIALGGVMKDWNTPQARQVASSSVTILFTDMVGSTDLTQAVGDAAAQDVIRAHNTIVRAALAANNGKEVKHTGDGIMASFDDPGDAVRAGVEIQQRVADHNARWPRLPLALRIGMNTGEPIIEENDYFGATVQIAARVCAAADMAQVWLSGATREAAGNATAFPLHDHGRQPLKGVREPVALYEVLWNPDRTAEIVATAAYDETAAGDGAGGGSGAPPSPAATQSPASRPPASRPPASRPPASRPPSS